MNFTKLWAVLRELEAQKEINKNLMRVNLELINQNAQLEEALKDADNEIVRLAELYKIACGRLKIKCQIIRWPQVFLSVKRKIARNNGTYNGVEAPVEAPMFPLPSS